MQGIMFSNVIKTVQRVRIRHRNKAFYRKISISRKNSLPPFFFAAICCPDIHSTPQPAALDGCGVILIVVG